MLAEFVAYKAANSETKQVTWRGLLQIPPGDDHIVLSVLRKWGAIWKGADVVLNRGSNSELKGGAYNRVINKRDTV